MGRILERFGAGWNNHSQSSVIHRAVADEETRRRGDAGDGKMGKRMKDRRLERARPGYIGRKHKMRAE